MLYSKLNYSKISGLTSKIFSFEFSVLACSFAMLYFETFSCCFNFYEMCCTNSCT